MINPYRLMVSLVITIVVFVATPKVFASGTIFYRTLSIGSYGNDVFELQKILNTDPSTRISGSGPGSPGRETLYFGPLTENAVVRFQDKYYADILVPNGLNVGTGIVGSSTRAVLSWLEPVLASTTPAYTTNTIVSVATSTSNTQASTTNPNLQNLDIFLADVTNVSIEQKVPAKSIDMIETQIRKDIATTTNLRQAFLNKVAKNNTVSNSNLAPTHPFSAIFSTIDSFLTSIIKPQTTFAQSVSTPFGGAVLYSYYCDCSDSWLIGLEPLPPDYPVLLSYIEGSQAFLSYNIPFTAWLLGGYESGAGICEVYVAEGCASVPSEGLITPEVGSSQS